MVKIRDVSCTDRNFKNGTISFKDSVLEEIKHGEIDFIKVTNNYTGESYSELIPAAIILLRAFKPYRECDYYVSTFIIPRKSEYITQKQLSEHWKIRQCRLSEVIRAELLIPDSKDGKTLLYLIKNVNEALKNKYLAAWLKNTTKVDSK